LKKQFIVILNIGLINAYKQIMRDGLTRDLSFIRRSFYQLTALLIRWNYSSILLIFLSYKD